MQDKNRQKLPDKKAGDANKLAERKKLSQIDHHATLLVSMYRHQLSALTGGADNMVDSSTDYVIDFIKGISPRDSVEQLLASQMLLTHMRVLHLNNLAQQQTLVKTVQVLNEAADRAANTFRRQVLSLAEYRRPPRQSNFTAIGQANIANQQVVQNGKTENQKTTNEQGSGSGDGQNTSAQLPLVSGGTGIPPIQRKEEQAMAEKQRTEDR